MDLVKRIAERRLRPRHEEDFVDRTNYVTTPFFLATSAILAFAKEYGPFSEPIYCWTQAEWNGDWLQYAHDYCFVESTYYVPANVSIPSLGARNNPNDRVSYYQWVPFILVVQALVCQFPSHFWRFCNSISSKRLPAILLQAHNASGKENEHAVAAGIGRHLKAVLLANGSEGGEGEGEIQFTDILSRNVLCFLYLAMKFMFLMINICQVIFISLFLGVDKTPFWGVKVLEAFLVHGTAWERNGIFPRVSLCDFKIRMPGERFADYTVQCVLMANFLNEKIFVALYYWFAFMSVLTTLNLFRWWWLLFRPAKCFVRRHVELAANQIFADPEPLDLEDGQYGDFVEGIWEEGEESGGGGRGGEEDEEREGREHEEWATTTPEFYASCFMHNNNNKNSNGQKQFPFSSSSSSPVFPSLSSSPSAISSSSSSDCSAALMQRSAGNFSIKTTSTSATTKEAFDSAIYSRSGDENSPPPLPPHAVPLNFSSQKKGPEVEGIVREQEETIIPGNAVNNNTNNNNSMNSPSASTSSFLSLETRQNFPQQRQPEKKGTQNATREKAEAALAEKCLESDRKRNAYYAEFRDAEPFFVEKLGRDGVLIFQLIDANAGPKMTSLIMGELFCNFARARNARRNLSLNRAVKF